MRDQAPGALVAGSSATPGDRQDARDLQTLLDLLEHEFIPLFHDRDADGVPRDWIQRVRASIRAAGQGFSARRMLSDYVQQVRRA